jgi:hypothetical protein
MPDATHPIKTCLLASPPGSTAMLVDFPPGLERMVPGGYEVQEEFLVLSGELNASGTTCRRGDLTVIPSGFERRGLSTTGGCLVLAWFSGRVEWLRSNDLTTEPGAMTTVHLPKTLRGWQWATPHSKWMRHPVDASRSDAVHDILDGALTMWTSSEDSVAAYPRLGDFTRSYTPA